MVKTIMMTEDRKEKSVTKTKTPSRLSRFFSCRLRFTINIMSVSVCSVLLFFGLVGDTGTSSIITSNQ